jgi:hypothetical protein
MCWVADSLTIVQGGSHFFMQLNESLNCTSIRPLSILGRHGGSGASRLGSFRRLGYSDAEDRDSQCCQNAHHKPRDLKRIPNRSLIHLIPPQGT